MVLADDNDDMFDRRCACLCHHPGWADANEQYGGEDGTTKWAHAKRSSKAVGDNRGASGDRRSSLGDTYFLPGADVRFL